MVSFGHHSILIFQWRLLWTSAYTLISTMTTLNISIYTYFSDDYSEHLHIHLFQRWLLWTSPYTLISKMTTLSIFYTYMSTMSALNIFTCTYFNEVSQCEQFDILLFQRWYTLNIDAGIWRCDTTSLPQWRNSIGGSTETAKNKASRISAIILGYCADLQSSCTLSNFGSLAFNSFTDEM